MTSDPADGASGEHPEQVADDAPARVVSETVTVRRSPRYARFMIAFSFVFVVVAFAITYSQPEVQAVGDQPGADRNAVFGFLALIAIALGVTVGSIVALLAERATRRSIRIVRADRTDTRRAEPDDDGDVDGASV